MKNAAAFLACACLAGAAYADTLNLSTSSAFGQVLAALMPALRDAGINLKINSEASSTQAIGDLASGRVDAALSVRSLSATDRAATPEKMYEESRIGTQAAALLVSKDVWDAGVRTLTREQARRIYEQEIKNWKEIGGPDRAIKFYSFEKGRGVWEQFVGWVYGEVRRAPLGKFEIVVTGDDAYNTVAFNGGSMALATPRFGNTDGVHALAIQGDTGESVAPTYENLRQDKYPISRPVYVIFGTKPTGVMRELRDFLLGETAQVILRKSDIVPVGEDAAASGAPSGSPRPEPSPIPK